MTAFLPDRVALLISVQSSRLLNVFNFFRVKHPNINTQNATSSMTSEDVEDTQSVDEGGVGGPGAPTPLSALEVSPDIVSIA